MKKNFLVLLWMTLLPLAGWAADILVKPVNIEPVYGDGTGVPATGAAVSSDWFTYSGATLSDAQVTELAGKLDYNVFQEIKGIGAFTYALTVKTGQSTIKIGDETYTIKVDGTGSIVVKQKPLSDVTLADIPALTYNGQARNATIALTTTIYGEEYTLVEGTDYTVTYADNVNAGDATATIEGKGNFTGSIEETYTISPLTITELVIGEIAPVTYTGSAATPTAEVTADGKALELGADKDYTIASTDINAGDATATITLSSNYAYTGDLTKAFTIAQKSLADDDILVSGYKNSYKYRGTAFIPKAFTVKYGDITLQKTGTGTDYTTSYGENINVATGGSFTIEAVDNGNYTGSKTINFGITPRSIAATDITITVDATDVNYTGSPVDPTSVTVHDALTTVNADLTDADFTFEASENINAGENTAVVTVTGQGNYTGITTANYSIGKAKLSVTANPVSKIFGSGNPTFTAKYDGWLGETDSEELLDKSGLTFKVYAEEDVDQESELTSAQYAAVGTYQIVPSGLSFVDGADENYDFDYVAGTLTVNQKGLTIVIANATKTFGDDDPDFEYTIEDQDGNSYDPDAISWDEAVKLEREPGIDVKDGGYAITLKEGTGISPDYTFAVTPGTLTIKPFAVTVKANPQTIAFGESPELGTAYSNKVKGGGDNPKPTVQFTPTSVGSGETAQTIGRASGSYGLNLGLSYDGNGVVGLNEGVLIVSAENNNFEITTIDGDLTITGATELELLADNTDEAKIKAYNNHDVDKVKVTLKRRNVMNAGTANEKTYSWNQYDWNTMVLPFDVTVRELSKAIGYAIVNRYDTANDVENNAKFKLWMNEIPANEPFLLKTDEDVAEDLVLEFENKTIKYATAEDMKLTATNGISFCGTYENVVVSKDTPLLKYYAINEIRGIGASSGNTYTVYPLASYFIWTPASSNAPAMSITVEGDDGNPTTSISGIKADGSKVNDEGWYGINGVKYNGVPTQKGIYIQNGKKVVIK